MHGDKVEILKEIKKQASYWYSATDTFVDSPASNASNGGEGDIYVKVDLSHLSTLWKEQQWWSAFVSLFMVHENSGHEDDLLFYVYQPKAATEQPFFVRRKGHKVPDELHEGGSKWRKVDWRRTVLLNIVLQTQYTLIVASCSAEDLSQVAYGQDQTSTEIPLLRICKQVFASPTRVAVNLDSSRVDHAEPQISYPDICFAVDNFEDAFEELVLSTGAHHYAVVLKAHSWRHSNETSDATERTDSIPTPTAAAPCEQGEDEPGSPGTREAPTTEEDAERNNQDPDEDEGMSGVPLLDDTDVIMFSGYVSYPQLDHAMGMRATSLIGKLFQGMRTNSTRTKRVTMRGPGGRGQAEVAVTGFFENAPTGASNGGANGAGMQGRYVPGQSGASPPSPSGAPVLTPAAPQVRNGAANRVAPRLHMRCALMSLGLPSELLACGLLGTAPATEDV